MGQNGILGQGSVVEVFEFEGSDMEYTHTFYAVTAEEDIRVRLFHSEMSADARREIFYDFL